MPGDAIRQCGAGVNSVTFTPGTARLRPAECQVEVAATIVGFADAAGERPAPGYVRP